MLLVVLCPWARTRETEIEYGESVEGVVWCLSFDRKKRESVDWLGVDPEKEGR